MTTRTIDVALSTPGLDAAQPSLISSFRDGDPNDFVR